MNITIEGNPIDPKLLALIEAGSAAIAVDRNAALGAINDATRALKRVVNRATPLPAEYERVELVQSRGPAIEFSGRLLCDTNFETRSGQPLEITLEVWETLGGALVAVSTSTLPNDRGREDCRALVVPPQADQLAMRLEVMAFFDWANHARSMVRKALRWSLKVEVE